MRGSVPAGAVPIAARDFQVCAPGKFPRTLPHRHDIARTKIVVRDVASKNGVGVECERHFLRRVQFARVDHVVMVHGAKMGGFDCRDGEGATVDCEEFHLEGFAILVGVDDGADIATAEAVGREVGQQMMRSSSFMLFGRADRRSRTGGSIRRVR